MELKTRRVTALAVVAAASLGGVLVAGAQQQDSKPVSHKQPDKPAMPPMDPKVQERIEQSMTLAPEHKLLDVFEGEWEGSVKFWMEPGGSPMESQGTVKRQWTLGDRFLKEEVDAASDMGPFKGLGFMGYNTVDKRYESFWIEDHATFMTMGTGKYDAGAKTFTFEAECPDPVTGKRTKNRHVIDVSDPARHVMTGYGTGPDGKEFKNFEGVFEKKR